MLTIIRNFVCGLGNMIQETTEKVKDLDFTLEPIDFTKDSEYIRLFEDDDASEEFMKEVYKKELGSNFEKVEDGVGVGTYESKPDE